MKKAFTLVETLIVLVIIGLLAVALTQSYLTISKIAFKIEQEKNLTEESLMLTQVFQSIADTATIDYEQYKGSLENTKGLSEKLYLTGGDWTGTSIYSSGDCLSLEGSFDDLDQELSERLALHSGCQLILEKSGKKTSLIDLNKVIISQVKFKIIPYNSEKNYFKSESNSENVLDKIAKPAFWMFVHLYSPRYQPTGANNVHQPLQLFFNLNAPIPSIFS